MIHELELLQIDEMKSQMERLVLFLSETESSKNAASGLKNGDDAQKLENSLKDSTVAEEISSDKSAVQSGDSRKTFLKQMRKANLAKVINLQRVLFFRSIKSTHLWCNTVL